MQQLWEPHPCQCTALGQEVDTLSSLWLEPKIHPGHTRGRHGLCGKETQAPVSEIIKDMKLFKMNTENRGGE